MSPSTSWKGSVEEIFSNAERITLMGIGRIESGDDGSGHLLIEKLKKRFPYSEEKMGIQFIAAEAMPENHTGEIRKFSPGWTILIDAADMSLKPGEIQVVDIKDIREEEMTSHHLPLSVVIRYIQNTIGCEVLILGIQPVQFCGEGCFSKPVKEAVSDLEDFFISLILAH